MATLQNYIALRDGVSPVLDRMSRASNNVASKMQRMSAATHSAGTSAETATGRFGMLKNVFLGTFGANIAMQALQGVQNALTGLISTADEYAGINARLKLIGGSQENAVALNEQIYQSALRARGGYLDMANAVATLATSARDAFPDPRDAVAFTEGINKLFTIGGVSGVNKQNAMLQLTQGMASGQLQGDEFRSISENAPIIQDMIAKTMGVARGKLKDLASEGEITADVIRRAVLNNMDEINAKFREMPQTWADQWTYLSNNAIHAFAPIMKRLNDLANSEGVRRLVDGIVSGINSVAPVFYWLVGVAQSAIDNIVTVVGSAYSFLTNNTWLLSGALLILGGYLLYQSIMAAIVAKEMVAAAMATITKTAVDWMQTAAILALIVAQEGLNAALYACPLTWIIGLIVALVAVFYLAVAAVNYFAGTSISATGIIFGVFSMLFTGIVNMVKFTYNIFVAFANFLGNVFNDPLAATYNLFVDIWSGIVDYVKVAVNAVIDMINKIPGINKAFGGALEHVSADAWKPERIPQTQYFSPATYGDLGNAFNAGYKVGDDVSNFKQIPDMPEVNTPDFDKSKLPAVTAYDPDGKEKAKNAKKTADNTKRIADNIEMSDEEINELRDSTMNSVLQQWQNQKVDINIVNNNTISNDMDLDGVTSDLVRGIREAWSAKGEGVLV